MRIGSQASVYYVLIVYRSTISVALWFQDLYEIFSPYYAIISLYYNNIRAKLLTIPYTNTTITHHLIIIILSLQNNVNNNSISLQSSMTSSVWDQMILYYNRATALLYILITLSRNLASYHTTE